MIECDVHVIKLWCEIEELRCKVEELKRENESMKQTVYHKLERANNE